LISALGNVGINVVFRVARNDAETMAKEIFSVDTSEIKHDAQADAQHPLYSSLGEQWEQATGAIQRLSKRQAYVKHGGREAFLMRTEPIKPYQVSKDDVAALLMQSAVTHGQPVSDSARPAPPVIQEREPIPAVDTRSEAQYYSQ